MVKAGLPFFKMDSVNAARILPDGARLWEDQSSSVSLLDSYSAFLDGFVHEIPFFSYAEFIRVKTGNHRKQNQKSCSLTQDQYWEKRLLNTSE